jgi:hypothetical protein
VAGSGKLAIQAGALLMSGGTGTYVGNASGATGIVEQAGGVVDNGGGLYLNIGAVAGSFGAWRMTGGTFSNRSSNYMLMGYGGSIGELVVDGPARFVRTGNTIRAGHSGGQATILVANGGQCEIWGGMTLPHDGGATYGTMIVTNGGMVIISNGLSIAYSLTFGSTGQVLIASGGVLSNLSASTIYVGNAPYKSSARIAISNGVFHSDSNVSIASTPDAAASLPAAGVELDGTQRVFRIGSSAVLTLGNTGTRIGTITNHVRKLAGGVDLLNTNAAALNIISGAGCRIHLAFDENPVVNGDFWGLRWAGTNGYATLVTYTNNGKITVANNLPAPFDAAKIGVYTNAVGDTLIGFPVSTIAAAAPLGTIILVR